MTDAFLFIVILLLGYCADRLRGIEKELRRRNAGVIPADPA